MKRLTIHFVLFSTILLIPIHSYAIKKLGQTGLTFLSIGMGARPAGMGEAFVVIGDDAAALYYNPAGIGKMHDKFNFAATITNWAAGISYNAFGLVINGGKWGNFGISIIDPNYGSVAGTRIAPTEEGYEETGQLDINAFATGFSYAREITDKFTVGGQIKYVSQHLGSNLVPEMVRGEMVGTGMEENKVSGLAYDLGTIFYTGFKSFGFGMSIMNFSPQLKYEETPFQLPLTFRIGFAMDILDFFGEHPNKSLKVEIDAIHPRDYTERLNLGAEYTYKDMISIRTGYQFNYDEMGLTMGVGFNLEGIKFDYAYHKSETFGALERVSLRMSF